MQSYRSLKEAQCCLLTGQSSLGEMGQDTSTSSTAKVLVMMNSAKDSSPSPVLQEALGYGPVCTSEQETCLQYILLACYSSVERC